MAEAVTPAEVSLTMQLTAEDWRDGFALLYRRRRRPWRIAVAAALPFLCLLIGILTGDYVPGIILFLVIGLWVIWLFTFGTRAMSGVQARRMLRDTPYMREELLYRFNAEGLTVAVGDQQPGGIAWRMMIGFSRDDKALILYDGVMRIRVFPRRLVSDADLDAIEAFARGAGLPER